MNVLKAGETRALWKLPGLKCVLTFGVFPPPMQFLISNLISSHFLSFPLSPKAYICSAAAEMLFFFLAPLLAPDLVTANNSSSTSLLIKWSHLSVEDYQGKPIGYNITYQSTDVKSGIRFVIVNHTTNTTELGSLTIYTMYEIYVAAVSSGGTGPANRVRAQTDAEGKEVLK